MKGAVLSLFFLTLCACSTTSVTRIGPAHPPRGPHCEIEVLEPGQNPTRPYLDVGMVTLENCQDYRTRPCQDRLVREACQLGGHVAYVQAPSNAEPELGQMRFRVMIGAYAGQWLGDPNDPLRLSRTCEPACSPEQICHNRTCIDAADLQPCEEGPQESRCVE